MSGRAYKSFLVFGICSCCLAIQPPLSAQMPRTPQHAGEAFIKDYSEGPDWFPTVFHPYQPQPLAPPALENSPRLSGLIRDGKLELSLTDALALALENNLDMAVQRYVLPAAQTDVLRAMSGQATRGIQGALVPSGLNAGALGAGVSAAGGSGGVGSAGGITGGGGAVQIGPSGTFDPTVSFNFSWDRVSSPLNTLQVAGVPAVTTYATAYTGGYAQLFPTGTSYFLGLSSLRQSSTQQFLRFNPAVISRFIFGFHQPLLAGFGLLPNLRFLTVARNNLKVSDEVFRQQVIRTVVEVENMYWDLVALQENVRVAEQSLAVAQRLHQENKIRAEVGTLAPLEVVAAGSEVAARERDLIVAQTNLQLQEAAIKNMISKKVDAELDAARIVTTNSLPEVRPGDAPEPDKALSSAFQNRPDLRQAQVNLLNQNIGVRHTENSLRPNVSVFGMYAGSGLDGNTVNASGGAGGSLAQTFSGDFPEQAGGLSIAIPIKNRAAQADNLRAQLEYNQLQASLQRARNQIALEVRQAVIGLIQGKAQVEAAREAVGLARQTLEAEQKKLQAGVSTSYEVILRERDLVAAQLAEVQAVAGYARARVEMDRSTGSTLEANGIQISDAVSGIVTRMPTPAFTLRPSGRQGR
ncbi:MAG: TolC family protein [Acidobacteria bacterium]|nr:TolC family protein [Acidobacteriota bacterium]